MRNSRTKLLISLGLIFLATLFACVAVDDAWAGKKKRKKPPPIAPEMKDTMTPAYLQRIVQEDKAQDKGVIEEEEYTPEPPKISNWLSEMTKPD
jgi:hypothetical protein